MPTAAATSPPLAANQKRGFLAARGVACVFIFSLILLSFSRDTAGQKLPA
jgi:hypothetical protein